VVFTWGDRSFTIPGYMVWCALAYAITGSWLTWLVGHPLIKLNAERYAKEADLRFAIVRINETAETVALGRGEANERRTADSSITSVIDLGCKLANGLSKLTWITSGYGWLAIIVPILVAVPGFFAGKLTIGGLMMVVGAFNQVQNSLKWFVDNFPAIADWRATLLRVSRFRSGLSVLDPDPEAVLSGITVGPHPAGQMSFESLSLTQQGRTMSFATSHIEVRQGERVLIESGADCDKSLFLRAMAGLWTEGTGRILLPPAASIMFIPARANFRIDTLREAMTYPADQGNFDDAMISAALVRVGLMHLVERLGDKGRWDRALPAHEQQRLVLARLVLHRPDWVLFEDMAATVNEQDMALLRSVFTRELSASAVIGVGSSPALNGFFARRLRMARHMDAVPRAAAASVGSGRPLEAAE
jgi:putative ATP-binding cassette transporter